MYVVFGGPFEQTQLKTPTDCTRKFEADTPLKKQMLDVIEHSVARELTSYNKLFGEHYPDRLNIAIANFNDYDPETYILVPATGEVFSAGIGPLDDDDLDRGGLVLQPLYRNLSLQSESVARRVVRNHFPPAGVPGTRGVLRRQRNECNSRCWFQITSPRFYDST